MVRNDTFYADKWINYYGAQFGYKNLYLFIDGEDQQSPKMSDKINCFQEPHIPMKRAKGDRYRARKISYFAQSLFKKYEVVLAMDIDEFLVLDPNVEGSLSDYLLSNFQMDSISALGIDVGQHKNLEQPIDLNKPFLSQRRFAQVSDRYTKPIVAFKPLTWGSGYHRVKGKNFKVDEYLFLFHFGLVDLDTTLLKITDKEITEAGWSGHMDRRLALFQDILKGPVENTESFIVTARTYFNTTRKWYAWNKPSPIKGNAVIEIPDRFKSIV